jgi:hypothetical protein
MHQNLLNAGFASVEYLNAENINLHVILVMQAPNKGVPAHAGKLSLHICLPSIALYGLSKQAVIWSSDPNAFFGIMYDDRDEIVNNVRRHSARYSLR